VYGRKICTYINIPLLKVTDAEEGEADANADVIERLREVERFSVTLFFVILKVSRNLSCCFLPPVSVFFRQWGFPTSDQPESRKDK
jgi:hypothetical protein